MGAVNDLRKDMNRQAFGDGRGTLCQISADGTNTVTVDNPWGPVRRPLLDTEMSNSMAPVGVEAPGLNRWP